ncbi:hypothetical protein COT99_00610 [Candidatus Falkowbacteria bacterium CG10_big_fil_rev_8_21_14_0_10_43_10]|uniref:Uncharacterized protein n=1 Tax=Candidatus Falkowbacteria bacterium CG10_big_fil_rev_8_21_14_0_10_43_10 TaxID=1974567 RepID=A0A2H0V301_9BACT|nr:MAG: hypothetical protein COT99_00610 [Candidatus Falkowbacteria bacterium CG10_big_fil_rev_8_21_14_0_10_43_10]
MPNPNLTAKEATALITLSDSAKDLFRAVYQSRQKSEKGEEDESNSKIRVNEIISKMSFFYEKIRNAVDYKEEHLLRKNAIERILRRLLMTGHAHEPQEMAKTLIIELIRAGYLANNAVLEEKIGEVAAVIDRFVKLRQLILAAGKKEKKEVEGVKKWTINLMATNIEEMLGDHKIDQVIGTHMFDIINSNILDKGNDKEFSRDKKIQIYIAIYSKLFKYDDYMLEYMLFRYFNSKWNNATDEDIALAAQHYNEFRDVVQQQLNHHFRKQIQKIAARYTVYFSILEEAIAENPQGTYDKLKNSAPQFKRLIEKICERRYKESRGKLRRGAVRSIIYIFLTKIILVFILEVPAILFLGDQLVYYSLAINVLFPPFLLFLIVMMTSVPGDENTAKIQAGIEQIVFKEKQESHPVKIEYPRKRKAATMMVFRFFYAVTFILTFGIIIWGLAEINFNIVSIIIFLFFLSLISFFGIRLGRFAKTYSVTENKEHFLSFFANFFYVPVVGAGKWMSETFSQINVFIFLLDFIIESPFKIFVEVFEQWTAYVKERKDQVVDKY